MRSAFGRLAWFMSAERISWLVIFPLQVYFAVRGRWIAVGVCVIASILVLTFRETIGNIRISWFAQARSHEQRRLDREAADCLKALRSRLGPPPRPIVLFLRAFSGDESIRSREAGSSDGFDSAPLESRLVAGFAGSWTTVSLRNPLGRNHLWGDAFANLPYDVSVGHPKFRDYEGRLFYRRPGEASVEDADWFDAFQLLAKSADLIVSVPIDASLAPTSSGTLIELRHIHDHQLLERCVFVMPPEQTVCLLRPMDATADRRRRGSAWVGRDFELSSLWKATRARLEVEGIALPEFEDTERDGAILFTLEPDGGRRVHVSLEDLSRPSGYLEQLKIPISRGE